VGPVGVHLVVRKQAGVEQLLDGGAVHADANEDNLLQMEGWGGEGKKTISIKGKRSAVTLSCGWAE
jgi:hypothetical protein